MARRTCGRFLAAAVLACAALSAGCAGAQFMSGGIEGRFWDAEVDTDCEASTDLVPGDKVDFESVLDVEDEGEVYVWRAWIAEAGDILAVNYWQIEREGEARLGQTFNFDGTTYPFGDDVESVVRTEMIRITWERDLAPSRQFSLRWMMGVNIVDAEFEINSAAVGRETWSETLAVPVIGLYTEMMMPMGFTAYGEIAGLWSEWHDFEGDYYESEMGVRWRSTTGRLSFSAFVRRFDLDFEHDDDEGSVRIEGPGFAAAIAF